jgi:hypothetical protein
MHFKKAVPVIATVDVRSTIAYYTEVLGFTEHFVFGDPLSMRESSAMACCFT